MNLAPPAHSIDEVVARLDAIIARARREGSRLGYFAVLYRRVTVRVRDGIAAGEFEDGARMARLDVIFANRYLAALAAYEAGWPVGESWRVAFEATRRWRPLILQHLLLGINAHIGLDLGIAAAETCPGAELASLRRDFDRINAILSTLIDEVQDHIAAVSPWMWVLDRVGQRTDEAVCSFCIDRARDVAWEFASCLAGATPSARLLEIERMDRLAAALATPIARPGPLAAAALGLVRVREVQSVPRVIEALE